MIYFFPLLIEFQRRKMQMFYLIFNKPVKVRGVTIGYGWMSNLHEMIYLAMLDDLIYLQKWQQVNKKGDDYDENK